MIKPFCIYEKATGRILSNKICDPNDLRLKEGQASLDGWFDDVEHVVIAGNDGQPTATRKPQEEIDAYRAAQAAHLEKAKALNIDPIAVLSEALRAKGIDIKPADLMAAKAKLQKKIS
jgi:hypothetical protein